MSTDQDPSEPNHLEVSIDRVLEAEIGPEGVAAINEMVVSYVNVYGSVRSNITISKDTWPIEQRRMPNGEFIPVRTLEKAYPGRIFLDPEVLQSESGIDIHKLKQIIAHSLTHALKEDVIFTLEQPLSVGNAKVYGFVGFLMLQNPLDGTPLFAKNKSNFVLIEEGIAELLASKLFEDKGLEYVPVDSYYQRLKIFTSELLQSAGIVLNIENLQRISRLNQEHDLLGFISLLLKGNKLITSSDITNLRNAYISVMEQGDIPSSISVFLNRRK